MSRTFRLVLRLVAAGLLLLVLTAAISLASFRAGFNARCKTVNMSGTLTPETLKTAQETGFAWTRRALACTNGDYLLAIPSEGTPGESAILFRKDRPLLTLNSEGTNLFDESGKRILFGITRANSTRVSMITYEGYDPVQHAFVSNIDIGADGSLDVRTTEVEGREVKREYRIGERWMQIVQHDGLFGVTFDGRFMSVADAIKLSEHAAPREGK